jgi:hypothetical protein
MPKCRTQRAALVEVDRRLARFHQLAAALDDKDQLGTALAERGGCPVECAASSPYEEHERLRRRQRVTD